MIETFASQKTPTQVPKEQALVLPLEEVGIADIPVVGGKNASLVEMIQQLRSKGVKVPKTRSDSAGVLLSLTLELVLRSSRTTKQPRFSRSFGIKSKSPSTFFSQVRNPGIREFYLIFFKMRIAGINSLTEPYWGFD